jgi:succinate dehydrogenase / fumarate reductase membrane anchor subunit
MDARPVSSAGGRAAPSGGFELYAWFFMRVSGVLLMFLALGHLLIMHIINNVDKIDYAFVVARWGTPLWRTYDFLLLSLALLHGFNGARVLVDDYLKGGKRALAQAVLFTLAFLFLAAGALVIFTFQPKARGVFF